MEQVAKLSDGIKYFKDKVVKPVKVTKPNIPDKLLVRFCFSLVLKDKNL